MIVANLLSALKEPLRRPLIIQFRMLQMFEAIVSKNLILCAWWEFRRSIFFGIWQLFVIVTG
jgi:hypothetical protein